MWTLWCGFSDKQFYVISCQEPRYSNFGPFLTIICKDKNFALMLACAERWAPCTRLWASGPPTTRWRRRSCSGGWTRIQMGRSVRIKHVNNVWRFSYLITKSKQQTIFGHIELLQLATESLRPSRFRQFLSPGCINFKNLSAHQQEEVLRIPKHPNLQNSDYFELSYGNLKKSKDCQKLVWYLKQLSKS